MFIKCKTILLVSLFFLLNISQNYVLSTCYKNNENVYVSDRILGIPKQDTYVHFSISNTCQTNISCYGFDDEFTVANPFDYDDFDYDDFEFSGEEGNFNRETG